MNAPVIGAEAGYAGADSWSAAFSWRYQKSDRHFVGSVEDETRAEEGSEVINWVHMLELAITRNFTDRWSVTVGIPYFMNQRSNPLRNDDDEVFARTQTQARGMGDVTVVPHWWAFKPETHSNYNLSLGCGIKLPTGDYSVEDARQNVDDGTPGAETLTNEIRTVDQSIQLGDGGFGVVLDVQGFYRFGGNAGAAYLTTTYLVNPENKNDAATYRGGDAALTEPPGSEAYFSIPDQYLYRVGAAWFPSQKAGLSLGLRWEGVPVEDLVGDSGGFRRPGYAFSIEPGFSYTAGKHTFSLLVPIAAHRDRKQSVTDRESEPPDYGDAAFADWVAIAGYFRRF